MDITVYLRCLRTTTGSGGSGPHAHQLPMAWRPTGQGGYFSNLQRGRDPGRRVSCDDRANGNRYQDYKAMVGAFWINDPATCGSSAWTRVPSSVPTSSGGTAAGTPGSTWTHCVGPVPASRSRRFPGSTTSSPIPANHGEIVAMTLASRIRVAAAIGALVAPLALVAASTSPRGRRHPKPEARMVLYGSSTVKLSDASLDTGR